MRSTRSHPVLSLLSLLLLSQVEAADPRQYLPLCPSTQTAGNLAWRVGDLHAHTKYSGDGKNKQTGEWTDPRKMIQTFQNLGYDFCSMTEHSDQMGDWSDVDSASEWQEVYNIHADNARQLGMTTLVGLEKTTGEYYMEDGEIKTKGGSAWDGGNHTLLFADRPIWIPEWTQVDEAMEVIHLSGIDLGAFGTRKPTAGFFPCLSR